MSPLPSSESYIHIPNATFTDVRGDLHYHAHSMSIHRSETGLLELFRASSPGAAFDSEERYPPPKCHPGTRLEVLNNIQRWIKGGKTKLCWLHGPAGAGKSAIAQTISETCTEGQLAASFFFSRSAPSRNNPRCFFTTIALQFAQSMPHKRNEICKAVEDDLHILHKQQARQLEQLIVRPILSTSLQTQPSPFLVIIDGLDECAGSREQSELLYHILELVEKYKLPLRFLIVSRPEPHILRFFGTSSAVTQISLYGDHRAMGDVRLFLQCGFDGIHDSERHADIMQHVPKPWPSDEVLQLLTTRSDGYFIYASTVLKYVDEEHFCCIDRLHDIVNISKTGSAAFAELDRLYTQVLSASPDTELLLRVLGGLLTSLIVLDSRYSPMDPENVEAAETLLNLRPGQVMLTLRGLHSVLRFSKDFSLVQPIHASFREFLFDRERAGKYHIDQEKAHADMVRGAADLIRDYHKRKSSMNEKHIGFYPRTLTSHLFSMNTTCRDPLLDYLQESSQAWQPYVSTSTHWSPDNQASLLKMLFSFQVYLRALEFPPAKLLGEVTKLFDSACRSHISSDPIAMLSALVIVREIHSSMSSSEVLFDISCPLQDDYHADGEVRRPSTQAPVMVQAMLRGFLGTADYYWHFLHDPKRSGDLYDDLAKCYARITNFWLLCLEASPDHDLMKSLHSNEARTCRKILLDNWSQFLYKCPPGDEALVCRLRHFVLEKASVDDVKLVIHWLKRGQNIPQGVLDRWESHAFERWRMVVEPSLMKKFLLKFSKNPVVVVPSD